jgi:hypothetical protein
VWAEDGFATSDSHSFESASAVLADKDLEFDTGPTDSGASLGNAEVLSGALQFSREAC